MKIISIKYGGNEKVFRTENGHVLGNPMPDSHSAVKSTGTQGRPSYADYMRVYRDTLTPIERVVTSMTCGAVGLFANQMLLTAAPIVELSPRTTSLGFAFYKCYALQYLPDLICNAWGNIRYFDYFCALLEDQEDESDGNLKEILRSMTGHVGLLAFPNIDLSFGVTFQFAFAGQGFQMVGDLDLSSALDVSSMFYRCENLESVGVITFGDADVVADELFAECYSLESIGEIDFTNLTGMYLFIGCETLKRVGVAGIISRDLSFEHSPLLEDETLLALCYHTGLGDNVLYFNEDLSAKADQYVKFDGNTLVWCESTDPETQGTLADFMTGKGWSLVFV